MHHPFTAKRLAPVLASVAMALSAYALDWQPRPGHRQASLSAPAAGKPGFTAMSATVTGITFTNTLSAAQAEKNSTLIIGSGLALGDIDGDGLCDLYLCRLEGDNVLYRNLGDWKFADITASAGVACPNDFSRGAVFADLDGDGDLDLLVSANGGGVRSFLNDGQGHFTENSQTAGLTSRAGSTTMALADIDGDGDLDLYVANFGEISVLRDGRNISVRYENGEPVATGRYANRVKFINGQWVEFGEPHALYLNDGKGNFKPVPWGAPAFLDEEGKPVAAPWDFGLSARFHDLNDDGFPDLYVCNDFQTPDRIWLNDGQGHFRALPRQAMRCQSFASMGVDFGDLDRDGRTDFLVVEMLTRDPARRLRRTSPSIGILPGIGDTLTRPQIERNTLFWNRGDGTYAEVAYFAGLEASEWSWQPVFLDVDLDGFEDILVSNGHTHDLNDMDANDRSRARQGKSTRMNLAEFAKLETPNALFRNLGKLAFQEQGQQWGFASTQISHGMAMADLDNDGDLDVVVNCLNAPPLLYRNDATAPRVAVRLKGNAPNTRGIGAQLKVLAPPLPPQTQEIISGGRYLSSDDAIRTFATGGAQSLEIQVTWRSGKKTALAGVKPNAIYEIDEAAAQSNPSPAPNNAAPIFADVSPLLNHQHHETAFDDYARQPLLPKHLSQLGPGVAWHDLDGDGHEDLIIGTGQGGQLAAFRNDGLGGFKRLESPTLAQAAGDDLTGLAAWTGKPGESALLVGLANYESGETNRSTVVKLDWQAGAPRLSPFTFHQSPTSTGPLAIADLDGDGDLDVFVGGRVLPRQYPLATDSRIYRNEKEELKPDPANTAVLKEAGMASGAVWSDLDGDGYPELILACEWGPVRVYQNDHGQLKETTADWGLAGYTGWWQSVAAGDFDGDGKMDLVAGNWGLNSPCRASAEHPALLYHGDFDGNGTLDLIEAQWEPAAGKLMPVQNLKTMLRGLPLWRDRFPSHLAYSTAGLAGVLGDKAATMAFVRATTLQSMVFLNRGRQFKAIPLPAEAQWSPAFGLGVADFDGDGHEDIFLAQNFTAVLVEEGQQSAGRGLWLRGDGQGGFQPVPGQESGIKVYGEQRGCATGDFDEDGRVDLVVTQNGAATKLFRNVTGKPGLRVRLAGPPGNPHGIGAIIRLAAGDKLGQAHEVHAGSGYWSQESVVPVMTAPFAATEVVIRWPGGKETKSTIPAQMRELQIDHTGKVSANR